MKYPKSLKYAVLLHRSTTYFRLFPAAVVVLAVSTLSAGDLTELHSRLKRAIPIPQLSVDNPAATSATFNTDQGRSGRDPGAICYRRQPRSARQSTYRTLDPRLPRATRAWSGLFNC